MKDNGQHIDSWMRKQLQHLTPRTGESDWDAIMSKMNSSASTEDKVVSTLKGFKPEITENDWIAIQQKMAQGHTRKPFGWWWLPLLLLVSMGFGYLWSNPQTKYTRVIAQNNFTPASEEISNPGKKSLQTETSLHQDVPTSVTPMNDVTAKPSVPATPKKPQGVHVLSASKEVKKITKPALAATNAKKINKHAESITDNNTIIGENPVAKTTELWKLITKNLVLFSREIFMPEYLANVPDKTILPVKDLPDPKINTRLTYSPFVAVNRYSSSFSSTATGVNNKRTGIEKPANLFDAGVKIQKNFGRIEAGSGFNYSVKGSEINGLVTHQIYDSFPHLDPNGNIIGYFRLNYRDTSTMVVAHNRYSFMEIPFFAGYPVNFGKHQLVPAIGTTLSFYTGSKGQNITATESLADANSIFFDYNKALVSMQINLVYRYRITPGLALETSAQWRNMLSNIYKGKTTGKYQLNNTGISLGINYRF